MGDFAHILTILRDASPWLVGATAIVVLVVVISKHREKMAKSVVDNHVFQLVQEIHEMLSTHCTEVTDALTGSKNASNQELGLLSKIASELVTLNARSSGEYISNENAKLIIRTQWAWCASETAKLLCNSIGNNNFRGNEELITRRLFRAWGKAAQAAQVSIKNFRGIKYPHERLFQEELPQIYQRIWGWAVPLYHAKRQSPTPAEEYTFKEVLDDLAERVINLFNKTIDAYFQVAEDIDVGDIYADEDPYAGAISGEVLVADDTSADTAAQVLRKFQEDEGSGQYEIQTVDDIAETMKQKKHVSRRHSDADS